MEPVPCWGRPAAQPALSGCSCVQRASDTWCPGGHLFPSPHQALLCRRLSWGGDVTWASPSPPLGSWPSPPRGCVVEVLHLLLLCALGRGGPVLWGSSGGRPFV
ncbi:hypothetical protein KIL84_006061 [Mauremys mutica]|uniref:Uncharacterized protein n=1 Tax=Mauremys mutica TaxID=74926 RepID=A0A9D3XHV1_9SAUR|nr:hypothetical protein KIL84_006061 [Mauremys mutica]